MDSGETIQDAPIQCSWCMLSIEKSFRPPLAKTGEHFCSRSCFLAKRYEELQNSTLFLLAFAIIFPLAVILPYQGDKIQLLGDFTGFYIIFVIAFSILIYLTYRARSVRLTRPNIAHIEK